MPKSGRASSQSTKMRKKRAAAKAAKAAAAPPPEPEVYNTAPAVFNPAPAAMPSGSDKVVSGDWDEKAVMLLKRLGKRDATTRLRALSELHEHIASCEENVAADAFLLRLGEVFSALLEDGHPRARVGALHLAELVAKRFRLAAKKTLRIIAPHWIAARADGVAAVSTEAARSLSAAFEGKEASLAAFTDKQLLSYCWELFGNMYGEDKERFDASAAKMCAVMRWVVEVRGGTFGSLSTFVDDARRPLALVACGLPAQGGTHAAPRYVAQLCTALVGAKVSLDEKRLDLASELVLHCLSQATEVWELLLVIFANGHATDAFGHGLPGLQQALVDALHAQREAPVDALLPLFARMPKVSSTLEIVLGVLDELRNMLGVDAGGEQGESRRLDVPAAYTLAVAPAYLECVRYVLVKGIAEWTDETQATAVRHRVAAEHVAPFAVAVFVGDVLPVAGKAPGSNAKNRRALRFAREKRDSRVVKELASTLASLQEADAIATVSNTPAAFLGALGGGKQSAVLLAERYAALLAGMPDSVWARTLAAAVVEQIVHPVDEAVMHSKKKKGGEAPLALLRVLADSVRAVPELIVGERHTLRDDCAKYAVNRAEVDAAAAGVVVAWAGWGNDEEFVENVILSMSLEYIGLEEVIFETIASIVRTHANVRYTLDGWKALDGKALQLTAAKAARIVQLRGKDTSSALELLAAVVSPKGGALLSDATHQAALVALGDCVRKGDVDATDCVRAVIAGDSSSQQQVAPFVETFVATVVAWGDSLAAECTKFLESSGRKEAVVDCVLDEMETALAEAGAEREEVLERSARNWKGAVDAFAVDDAMEMQRLHGKLLTRVVEKKTLPVDMLEHLLEEVEPVDVFGGTGDEDAQVDPDILARTFRLLCLRVTELAQSVAIEVTELVGDMTLASRVAVAEKGAKEVICDGCADALRLVAAAIRPDDEGLDVENAVARIVQQTATLDGDMPRHAALVVELIEIATACSARRTLACFRPTLDKASASIRSDPTTERAQFATMLLCAAWAPAEDAAPLPQWLLDAHANAVRASRSYLQTQHLMRDVPKERRKDAANAASTTGAVLLARALQVQGPTAVREEDWRFWPHAIKEALLDAQYDDPKKKKNRAAIANLAALAVAFVQAQEEAMIARQLKTDVQDVPVRIDSDTLCAHGAWAAVNFLPDMCADDDTYIVPVDPSHLAKLVQLAAARDVLIRGDAELPLAADKVYALVPLLDAADHTVRDAVAAILTRVALAQLPAQIAAEFPENGFEQDEDEAAYAASIIPASIRGCLEWSDNRTDVGYYAGWRVFLDLIAPPKDGKPVVNQHGENVSLRRFGIAYLRENDALFENFFKRCVNLVVCAPPEDRDKAMLQATGVLENVSSGTKAQGLQLAKEREEARRKRAEKARADQHEDEDDDDDDDENDDNAEEMQALRAAGTAFALALQRLPALSRQVGTERLPHGTVRVVERFVEERVSRLLIAAEIDRVRAWGSFGGGVGADAELTARGSVAGREVTATYTYSDVVLEIELKLPTAYPLQLIEVVPKSALGMSEAKWRKTVLAMATLLRMKDGSVVEAVELWRRNLDKTFAGAEECPICYSVLHINSATLPRMKCRTCKHLFHSECLCRWFKKSNSAACPLCRSAF